MRGSMDDSRFDELTKGLGAASRRSLVAAAGAAALAALFGREGVDEAVARRKKRKGKGKNKKKDRGVPEPCGGETVCTAGSFCCDDQQELCCAPGSECCNPGAGTGSCCPSPNRCGRPWGNDNAPFECCPPERQWFTYTGIVRCCPEGTRSLGTGITSDDGPCCPEEKYCGQFECCGDLAPICVNQSTGRCCTEADKCGTDCCGFNQPCCNGRCCSFGQICDGGACKCPSGVLQCGDTCCHAAAVGCEGSRCLNQCDLDPYGCGG
jgi:hypothetical protein